VVAPFLDLLQILISCQPSRSHAKALVSDYVSAFECSPMDVKLYLYISMANVYGQIENYPLERFKLLLIECRDYLNQVIELPSVSLSRPGALTEVQKAS
jgi:hypothetical protein